MGYLAFPPGSPTPIRLIAEEFHNTEDSKDAGDDDDRAYEEILRVMDERRRKRKAKEREEAFAGEKHWVRQGGTLRDANGRRDLKRTEEIRRIIEREDREQRIRDRWMAYERAWTELSASGETVTFADVPWPMAAFPTKPAQLRDPAAISTFLFESLSLPENTTTWKDRLRISLLRWHPDKLGGVISRAREDERAIVKEGIEAVFITLRLLQEEERGSKSGS